MEELGRGHRAKSCSSRSDGRIEFADHLRARPSAVPAGMRYPMADELEPPSLAEMRVAIDSVLPPRRVIPWALAHRRGRRHRVRGGGGGLSLERRAAPVCLLAGRARPRPPHRAVPAPPPGGDDRDGRCAPDPRRRGGPRPGASTAAAHAPPPAGAPHGPRDRRRRGSLRGEALTAPRPRASPDVDDPFTRERRSAPAPPGIRLA